MPPVPTSEAARLPAVIAAALARGATVLTASARAARALHRAFAEDARARNLTGWPAPAIRDWNSWLDELYKELVSASGAELPLLLSPAQEELLWKQVQSDDAGAVVSPDRLAQLAQSAYALLSEYLAHSGRRAPWAAPHEDAERFLAWAAAFDRRCEEKHLLSRAELPSVLREHASELRTAPELLTVGFDRLTPAQNALLERLRQTGVLVDQAAAGEPAPGRELLAAQDEAEELRACAFWIRARLEQNPSQRIGILAPQLRGPRAEVDRVFRRVLLPRGAAQPAGTALPYEFSLGHPLASIPLIASALLLLRWLAAPLEAAAITGLLTGGFLAADARQHLELAQLDSGLRRHGLLRSELSVEAFLRLARERKDLFPAEFAARLAGFVSPGGNWRTRLPAEKHPRAAWLDRASAALEAVGWPGFRELDSVAWQAREQWDKLLAELASLDAVGPPLRRAEFVAEIHAHAQDTIFSPESRQAPVQILGASEASGQTFDAVWLLGATEDRWPARGRLHPLLAPALQRDAAMPHALPEADLQLAQEQMRRIAAAAPLVVCSYALLSDGSETRMSPLLRDFDQGSTRQATAAAALLEARRQAVLPAIDYAVTREPDATRITPWPLDRPVGSDALKRQSACAFQSFAARRLGARPRDEEAWALDAGERGVLLHKALQELWTTEAAGNSARLHTLEDLERAIEDGTIQDKVGAAIDRAFRDELVQAAWDPWRTRHLRLEQERLQVRILWWLDIERKRSPFHVIALEQRTADAHIGELKLNLRVDRVDELPDGARLLLDYKTGTAVNTKLWNGERPEDPQLPLYARFGGIEGIAALGLGQIRAGCTALHAVAQDPPAQLGAAARAQTLEPETLIAWDIVLSRLAREFAQGEATVDPRDGNATCQYCGLHGLCRIRSQGAAMLDESETMEAESPDV